MPRSLKDDAGNLVEVPDETELAELQQKAADAAKLADELKALEDKSVGLRNLRDAVKRKDSRIAELEELVGTNKKDDDDAEDVRMNEDDIRAMARKEAMGSLLDMELNRKLATYPEGDRKLVKTYFDKLTAGEDLNMETVHAHLLRAERAAFPERDTPVSRGVSYGGHAPRSAETAKGFGDTPEGKAFAEQMGLNINPPKQS